MLLNHFLPLGVNVHPWDVGSGTEEQNGTFDMIGNVIEWNEALIGSKRGSRGGSCYGHGIYISSSWRASVLPIVEYGYTGFRVAEIPEPATLLLLGLGGLMLRKRRQT